MSQERARLSLHGHWEPCHQRREPPEHGERRVVRRYDRHPDGVEHRNATGTSGNPVVILPNKSCGTNQYVTIQSSAAASLPAGTRVSAARPLGDRADERAGGARGSVAEKAVQEGPLRRLIRRDPDDLTRSRTGGAGHRPCGFCLQPASDSPTAGARLPLFLATRAPPGLALIGLSNSVAPPP